MTTVGQLNFFRCIIQNNVLKYIIDNYKNIEEDMNQNTTRRKGTGKSAEKKVLVRVKESKERRGHLYP